MKAMIFAAGLGTRLKPLTDTLPKALVMVSGKPLIYYVITKLKSAGISEMVINVHHFADSIIGYVREQDDFGIKITFSDERDFLRETGGGILYARRMLEDGPFLVHNVDIISDLDIRWFMSQTRPDALSNILVSDRKTQRYFLFDDDMVLAGWMNTATGEIRSPYRNLNPDKFHKYAFAGIHLVSDGIFKVFDQDGWDGSFSVKDFYVDECAKHQILGVLPNELRLMDIGKPASLAEADSFIKTLNNK